ncbi:hypothetical protein L6164_011469 [Bauhinia variegata]|uniref:Uncharacterized protein n=1 Tax=Bauhinia variegata TaxID=167791 RepID=A0ACB9P670_BAUVA|nr:hypothetical protein L6164_011469 [Bauhinia variegata]
MSCIRSSYPSFYLFLFSIFLFVIFPSATSHSHSSPIPDGVEIVGRRQYDEVLLWKTRSLLAKETSANSSHLLLAENRTRRPDPLDHYNTYTGGWNISSTHYIASVISTAVPFFGIAAVWFMIFGLTLSLLCLCYCCCRRREPFGYSRVAYALSLILLVLFTLAAIAGCIVLYTGQGKFHTSTSDTLGYVVSQAYLTAETLRNVSGYLDAAKHIGVDAVFLPTDVQQKIDDVKMKINSAAVTLSTKTEANSKKIQHGIDQMRMTLIIVAAIMLFLAFLGFLFSILGMQVLVYILVVFGWVLVAVTFVLCGIFLFLHNAVGDACVAMDEWVQNPTAHTALDDILPCVDNATAQEILLRTEDVTYKLVNLVDTAIANVSNREFPPSAGIVYYNQSGPHMPLSAIPSTQISRIEHVQQKK